MKLGENLIARRRVGGIDVDAAEADVGEVALAASHPADIAEVCLGWIVQLCRAAAQVDQVLGLLPEFALVLGQLIFKTRHLTALEVEVRPLAEVSHQPLAVGLGRLVLRRRIVGLRVTS